MPQTAAWVRARPTQELYSFGRIGMRLLERIVEAIRSLTLSDPLIVKPFEWRVPYWPPRSTKRRKRPLYVYVEMENEEHDD